MTATRATPSSRTYVRCGEAMRARNIIDTWGARLPPTGGVAAVGRRPTCWIDLRGGPLSSYRGLPQLCSPNNRIAITDGRETPKTIARIGVRRIDGNTFSPNARRTVSRVA